MPWASQEVKDEIGLGSYERKLNKLAQEGWEVIESSTSAVGNFLYLRPVTTTLLRRDRELPEE